MRFGWFDLPLQIGLGIVLSDAIRFVIKMIAAVLAR